MILKKTLDKYYKITHTCAKVKNMNDSEKKLDKQVMTLLDEDQKVLFLKTLLFASKIDGKVDDQEIRFIKKMAQKYKVQDAKKVFENITKENLLTSLSGNLPRRGALELVKELFLMGHVDTDFCVEEILFVSDVGKALGLNQEKLEQISHWVIDYLILKEQGTIIFEENN